MSQGKTAIAEEFWWKTIIFEDLFRFFKRISMGKKRGLFGFFSDYRQSLVICGAPILAFPLLIAFEGYEKQARCAYTVAIMGSYWVFEALPLAITALIPMVAFPFFEIMKSEDVATAYLPDTSFLFIGGLMVAVAVEKSELHTRIALMVLKLVGSQPRWIMAGFMGVTGFLSMWISNTATAALMVPIVQSVIIELVENNRIYELAVLSESVSVQNRRRSVDLRRLSLPQEQLVTPKDMTGIFSPREMRMAKGLLISVCFAANIGGSATITGTASNLVFLGQLEKLFPNADTGVNFLSWLTFAFPPSFLCLFVCWLVLCIVFLRDAPKGSLIVTRKLADKYDQLDPISFAEVAVSSCFLLLLSLWIFREPQIIPGFNSFFKQGYISDATSAIFVVILLFVIPDKSPMCLAEKKRRGHYIIRESLLDWPTIQERFPWSVVLLLGGGFALAAGESELSHEIGMVMQGLSIFPLHVIMLICLMITVVLTNICSNTVVASIFIPIVAELARGLDINPLYFMFPVAIGSSFAFLLPVATPPNAIVFGSGIVKVKDMAIAGFFVTCACTGVTVFSMFVWARWLFTLDEFPLWAYDDLHPMKNMSLIEDLLRQNKTIAYPHLPFNA